MQFFIAFISVHTMLNSMLIFLFVGVVSCGVLPVEKCKLEDSSCLKQSFQKAVPIFMAGIPEYGMEVLDVLKLDSLKFELAGLKFSLKDGRVKGLKKSVIDDVKWDLKGKSFEIRYHFDAIIEGQYTADGRILVLPITGDGQMKLKLKNVNINLVVKYMTEKRDGMEYVKPKSFSYTYDVKDGANFHLTNLFNGNKELSEPMLVFLNENWKDITKEFGRPLMDNAGKKIFKSIVGFFAKEQISDIIIV